MAANPNRNRVKLSLTPLSAICMGALAAMTCMVMPSDVLEVMILDSGIPALLPAAAPPLGWTARTALAMVAGGGVAALTWLGAYLLLGGEGVVTLGAQMPAIPALPRLPSAASLIDRVRARLHRPAPNDLRPVPVLRRADAHPDAPARAPLLATRDLGVPFLDVHAPASPPVERELPRDLDVPLSSFDPYAIPGTSVAQLPPMASAIQEEGERFDTFELRPAVPQPRDQPPIAAPRTDATIHALLDRLERGVSARKTPPTPPSDAVDHMLGDLRRLATR